MRYVVVLAAAALTLAGCGGATSEDQVTSSVSSLSRVTSNTSTTAPAASAGESPENQQQQEPSVQDRAAQEISSLPEITPERTAQDEQFLDDLQGKQIKVDGIEDQLIAAAAEVCRAEELGEKSFTVDAVAGQLVEQGRSSESPEALANSIADAAKTAYC